MKIGDRIRVFEVTEEGAECYKDPSIKGKQATEIINSHHLGNKYGVDINLNSKYDTEIHVGIDERNHAKQIGTLVITKIK